MCKHLTSRSNWNLEMLVFILAGLLAGHEFFSYKVYKLERPQRQGVESCRILSRPGSVKHLK